MVATSCGFESHHRHQTSIIRTKSSLLKMGSDYLFSSRSSRIRISETAWSSVPNPSPEGRENQRYRGVSERRQAERFAPLTAAARRAFWQTRRASTACACPPAWILRFRLRLDENGAHIRHAFAERERDGLAVVGEPVGFAALALVQQIGEQER